MAKEDCIETAISLVREAKGGSAVDHLDAAEHWLGKAQEEKTLLLRAVKCFLGHATGNLDGDWDISADPVSFARNVIEFVGA